MTTVAIRLGGVVYYGYEDDEAHTDCLQRIVSELHAEQDARAKLLADIDSGAIPIEFGWPSEMKRIPVGFRDDGEGDHSWRKDSYIREAKKELTSEIEGLGQPGYVQGKCNCSACRHGRLRGLNADLPL